MTELPSDQQRAALCDLVARALVRVRLLARESGHAEIEELADAFHDLPREIHGWGHWSPEVTRARLAQYCSKYGQQGWVEEFDRIMSGEI